MASRPDWIPEEFSEEFRKLHDQVPAVPFSEIETVLTDHFGQDLKSVFREINTHPIGAASIAQVYRATLLNGDPVVVKVQRPGIEKIIQEDLSILVFLVELIEKYVPEVKVFNPSAVFDEFARTLEMETNFIIEANNIRRFQQNFSSDPTIKVPDVHMGLTGRRVLVMEALNGIPLSQRRALDQEGIDPQTVLRRGLRAYLKMVFTDGLFHGDLHAGNMFVLPDNKIGLIDFGVVGRLNRKTQSALANMLVALAEEDYDRLAYQYVDLAPFSDHVDVDRFSRDLRDLIAPFFGLNLKHVNIGRLLLDSTAVAAEHGLLLPSELVLFFKSIVTIEGMGRLIDSEFDFMAHSLEFASELVRSRFEGGRLLKDATALSREVNSLIGTLPRQVKQFLRRINNPDWELQIRLRELESLQKSVEKSANLNFLGLVIAGLTISSAMFYQHSPEGNLLFGMPILPAALLILASALGLLAFYNYMKR